MFYKDGTFQQCKGCSNFGFESNLISQFEENVISFDFLANALTCSLKSLQKFSIQSLPVYIIMFIIITVKWTLRK